MDKNFKFDEELKEINCFNGLFHLFAFNFQNSPSLIKKSTFEFTNVFRNQTWVKRPPLLKDHFSSIPRVVS